MKANAKIKAGDVAAIRASQLGAKAVLIEEREIGGTCHSQLIDLFRLI